MGFLALVLPAATVAVPNGSNSPPTPPGAPGPPSPNSGAPNSASVGLAWPPPAVVLPAPAVRDARAACRNWPADMLSSGGLGRTRAQCRGTRGNSAQPLHSSYL